MVRLPEVVRGVVGPPVRRVRREVQWLRPEFRLAVGLADAFPHDVAQHATPLIRELAGLDLLHRVQEESRSTPPVGPVPFLLIRRRS